MKGKIDNDNQREALYGPVQRKTSEAAFKVFFSKELPQFGGLAIDALVKELMKLIDQYYPSNKNMRMGQIMWPAIDINETSGYGKPIEKCKLKPVLLDLIKEDDILRLIKGESKPKISQEIAVRLFKQAEAQKAVLSCSDVGVMLNLSAITVARLIREYNKTTSTTIPTRGILHDIGPSVTHKRQICYKVIVEGKSVEQVANETNHSPEAITRYVKDYKRISSCLANNLSIGTISFITMVSKKLIYEYVNLIKENDIDISPEMNDNDFGSVLY